ncbi:hypothetical protein [Xanthomonas sp. 1678]|uniref:DUF7668 domain-containing protein n=1 Tax=Xanthomonas sp. 1678 TaxID=3158788 RepID=UPI00285DDDD5|nr:hypothetical protein [Xanthomonas translucens]
MKDVGQPAVVLAIKDGAMERPIPTAWRDTLRGIADALAAGDHGLSKGLAGVAPVPLETASQIRGYLQAYGATLAALPEATWETSVCIWYGGHWDALIDLWTLEEGRSDLVLQVRVTETDAAFAIQVCMVYVP